MSVSLLGLTSRWGHGSFLLEALRGERVSSPFSASQGHLHSLTHGPFLRSLCYLPPSIRTLVVIVDPSR